MGNVFIAFLSDPHPPAYVAVNPQVKRNKYKKCSELKTRVKQGLDSIYHPVEL